MYTDSDLSDTTFTMAINLSASSAGLESQITHTNSTVTLLVLMPWTSRLRPPTVLQCYLGGLLMHILCYASLIGGLRSSTPSTELRHDAVLLYQPFICEAQHEQD